MLEELDEKAAEEMYTAFPEGLRMFLFAPDCDAVIRPRECRIIYDDIKDMHLDMPGHNYGDYEVKDGVTVFHQYNMLERWKSMFRYCATKRVNMYFT